MAHGNISIFDQHSESWTSYSERLGYYLMTNDITDETKKEVNSAVVQTSRYLRFIEESPATYQSK